MNKPLTSTKDRKEWKKELDEIEFAHGHDYQNCVKLIESLLSKEKPFSASTYSGELVYIQPNPLKG